MIINKAEIIEGYELKIINTYRLKEIMLKFVLSQKSEHRIQLGEQKEEKTLFEITGLETTMIRNLRCTDTGKRDWTGGFYNEHSYQVYINEYDEYACPEIYRILGGIINNKNSSGEKILPLLARLSEMCDLKKFPLKKVFDEYIDEILSLIVLERKNDDFIRKLNDLYKILYEENNKGDIFPEQEFLQKYKVYRYDLKNIKKV